MLKFRNSCIGKLVHSAVRIPLTLILTLLVQKQPVLIMDSFDILINMLLETWSDVCTRIGKRHSNVHVTIGLSMAE